MQQQEEARSRSNLCTVIKFIFELGRIILLCFIYTDVHIYHSLSFHRSENGCKKFSSS